MFLLSSSLVLMSHPPWPQCFCSQASSRPIFFARSLAFSDVFLVKPPCPNVPPPWSKCFCSQASSRPIFLPEAWPSPMFLSSSSLVPMPHLPGPNVFVLKPHLVRSFLPEAWSSPMFLLSNLLSSGLLIGFHLTPRPFSPPPPPLSKFIENLRKSGN